MPSTPLVTNLNWTAPPLAVAAAWPAACPLFVLYSGRFHPRWARWSILTSPVVTYQFDVKSQWVGSPPPELQHVAFTHDAMQDLDIILTASPRVAPSLEQSSIPFHGGWIGCLSYDLGRIIEPAAQWPAGAIADRNWPLIELGYCPSALLYDHHSQRWLLVGDGQSLPLLDIERELNSDNSSPLDLGEDYSLGTLRPHVDADRYVSMVSRTIEFIAAGDVFQANITQRFSAAFAGSLRSLGLNALARAMPWYGAHLELGQGDESTVRSAVSLSPELFLQLCGRSQTIITRPIKGTRPASVDPQNLLHSEKDAAELHMIIDLMRNDLGRVCEYGSVQVPTPRMIESHPTIHHGVGEVIGRLRSDVTAADLLRATFPGGSITGAPKIRAMQIIDALEPVRRGPYCGAIGYFSNCGNIGLNIAIRTMLLTGQRDDAYRPLHITGTLDYAAGAGIVADSNPLAEYHESLDKTAVLRAMLRNDAPAPARGIR